MATFTMKFKDTIEFLGAEIHTAEDGSTILDRPELVGLAAYPIFQPSYRTVLNGLIVDRYLNREIGVETPDMFKQILRTRMREIMPLFNRLYEADRIEFDPLSTMDIRTVANGTAQSDTESSSRAGSVSESESVGKDYAHPQSQLNKDEDYLSAAAKQNSKTTGDNTSSDSAKGVTRNDNESRVTGYQGSPAALLTQFRESLIQTDTLVLDRLEDCFMQIFDSDDSYTNNDRGYYPNWRY